MPYKRTFLIYVISYKKIVLIYAMSYKRTLLIYVISYKNIILIYAMSYKRTVLLFVNQGKLLFIIYGYNSCKKYEQFFRNKVIIKPYVIGSAYKYLLASQKLKISLTNTDLINFNIR